jgi:alanine racemase
VRIDVPQHDRQPGRLSRPNACEIDLTAIGDNLAEVRKLVGPEVLISVAMKANAYGIGLLESASVIQESEANRIAVADPYDAVRLRDSGITLPLLLYPGALMGAPVARLAEERNVMVTVTSRSSAAALSRAAGRRITVMAKVDVGLERLGIPVQEALGVILDVAATDNLSLEGIYTHLHAPAGQGADEYVDWQLGRFRQLLADLSEREVPVPVAMASSTPVLARLGAAGLNAVDIGRLVYGNVRTTRDVLAPMQIRPAFVSLRSRLIQCKRLSRTDYPDLAPYPVHPEMRIGLVPIGYSDGIDTCNSGVALVRGQRAPIVASASLEHTRLDITGIPAACEGDEVVFVGTQGNASISAEDVLTHLGAEQMTSMTVGVRSSVPRIYRYPAA